MAAFDTVIRHGTIAIASPTFPTGPQNLRFSDYFAVKAESLQRAEIGKPL
jgi:hypothetical protein